MFTSALFSLSKELCAYGLSAKHVGIHPSCGLPTKIWYSIKAILATAAIMNTHFKNEPSKVSNLHDFSPVISTRILYFRVLMVVRTVSWIVASSISLTFLIIKVATSSLCPRIEFLIDQLSSTCQSQAKRLHFPITGKEWQSTLLKNDFFYF